MRLWPREASMRKVYKLIRFLVNYSFTMIFFADLTPNSEAEPHKGPPECPPVRGPRYLPAPRPLGDDLQVGIEQTWVSTCAQQGKLDRRARTAAICVVIKRAGGGVIDNAVIAIVACDDACA